MTTHTAFLTGFVPLMNHSNFRFKEEETNIQRSKETLPGYTVNVENSILYRGSQTFREKESGTHVAIWLPTLPLSISSTKLVMVFL